MPLETAKNRMAFQKPDASGGLPYTSTVQTVSAVARAEVSADAHHADAHHADAHHADAHCAMRATRARGPARHPSSSPADRLPHPLTARRAR